MVVLRETIVLAPKPRGFHLITDEIMQKFLQHPTLRAKSFSGLMNISLLHTSASISLNENCDPSVRTDFETFVNDLVPENYPHFRHTYEGSDDMPAHIKSSLFGTSLTIQIWKNNPVLGTWQGIYINEHRDRSSGRSLSLMLMGTVESI